MIYAQVEKHTETLATEVKGLKQVASEYNKIMQSHEDRTVKLEKDAGFTNVALDEHQTKIAKFQKVDFNSTTFAGSQVLSYLS